MLDERPATADEFIGCWQARGYYCGHLTQRLSLTSFTPSTPDGTSDRSGLSTTQCDGPRRRGCQFGSTARLWAAPHVVREPQPGAINARDAGTWA